VRRVLLLGGSVTFGRTATSNETTIAGQLEKKLNSRQSPKINEHWEVINLGIPDFISYQELIVLIKNGLQYEPDVVISLTGFNDIHHYISTGKINTPTSMKGVAAAYNAFFSGAIHRLAAFLGTFLISIQYISILLRRIEGAETEELSPFIYTIW